MVDTEELKKAAKTVSLTAKELAVKDLSNKLLAAAEEIEKLRDFAIWLTGCGYDFCQHEYYVKKRNELLKNIIGNPFKDDAT